MQAVIDKDKFMQAQSVLRPKLRQGKANWHTKLYAMVIVPCSICGRLFKLNREKNMIYDKKGWAKNCPICKGEGASYLIVSEAEKKAIKNLHDAQGCTKRKMTPEERIKYGLPPVTQK